MQQLFLYLLEDGLKTFLIPMVIKTLELKEALSSSFFISINYPTNTFKTYFLVVIKNIFRIGEK